jgi:peroxiredoxin
MKRLEERQERAGKGGSVVSCPDSRPPFSTPLGSPACRRRTPGRDLALPVLLLAALVGCGWAEEMPGRVDSAAPHYAAPDMAGDTVALSDLRGEVVLVNIWATWCPPCRIEMPHLQRLQEELGDRGFRVVGVSVDSRGSETAVERFARDVGVDFLILRDPGERISSLFGAYGVPFNLLIDRDGMVRWRHTGPVTADDPHLREILEETLGSAS